MTMCDVSVNADMLVFIACMLVLSEGGTDVCVIFTTYGKQVHLGTSLQKYRLNENNLMT